MTPKELVLYLKIYPFYGEKCDNYEEIETKIMYS